MPDSIETINDLYEFDFKTLNFEEPEPQKKERLKRNHICGKPLNFKPTPYQPPVIYDNDIPDALPQNIPIAIGEGDIQFVEIKVKKKLRN